MDNQKGLTLIELLLSIVILGLILSLISIILFNSFDIFRDSSERVTEDCLLQIMVQDITSKIREAKYFDFRTANTWTFYSGKDADDNLLEGFTIKLNNNNQLSIIKSGKEVRKIDNVISFSLTNYAINFYEGSGKAPDSSAFEFEIEVDLGNNIIIEKQTVYSRNL
ncbi:MAG: hypothetical protein AWL62_991 [Halanaerobium sp. T82-1]|nr:MAG: hypothetical protein AWL62_991 [Halanaerobium sp. T82-1]